MINRYQGNTGKVVRVEEKSAKERHLPPPQPPPEPIHRPPPAKLPGLVEQLGRLLPSKLELETEDLILLLILYLMYRESGDSELLIIMGAMFLL